MNSRAARMLVGLLALIAVTALSPVTAEASGSATKTVTQHGLTVTLTATPVNAASGQTVRFSAQARTQHASGALIYGLAYGDGTHSRPVAIPQYCLAGAGRPATGAWHFTHSYRTAGRYEARFSVAVNCSGESAAVRITVNVAS